jgi:hypothetical protein
MAGADPTSSFLGAFDEFELFSSPIANRGTYSAADFDIMPRDMFDEGPLGLPFFDVQAIHPMPEVITAISPPKIPISPVRPRRPAVFRPFTSFEDVELTVVELRNAFRQPADRPALAAGLPAATRRQPCSKETNWLSSIGRATDDGSLRG